MSDERHRMEREYLAGRPSLARRLLNPLINPARDYRNVQAEAAFARMILEQPADAICVSVGGGPAREHPRLLNLNIGMYPNVDVVGTAYALPFRADSVGAVFCSAVLEHLEYPDLAVSEMFRVLRPGGQAYAATPFLQAFHGYPNHFQNFTLPGHERLFERAGFTITASGAGVGPVRAVVDIVASMLRELLPAPVGRIAATLWLLLGALIRPLDRFFNRSERAHRLASTTFVHCLKAPRGGRSGG